MANVCNLEQLSGMTGGDTSVMKEFIRMYLADTPQLVLKIRAASAAKNFVGEESVAWCCHKIAPQLSYMGIAEGYDLAKNTEAKLKELTAGYTELDNDLSRLNDICMLSYRELNDFMNSNPD
jgi:HPt (histidine-containing phosphotransfer) domain-containing protein